MTRMSLRAMWLTAASALAFVINVVLRCSKNRRSSKPSSSTPRSGGQANGSIKSAAAKQSAGRGRGEQEALLSAGGSDSEASSSGAATGATSTGGMAVALNGIDTHAVYAAAVAPQVQVADVSARRRGTNPGSAAPTQTESSAELTRAQLRKKQRSITDGEQAGGVNPSFLQGLIEAELGPPKFAVSKQQQPVSSSDKGSLEYLLDQQFGPPRFAVPKADQAATAAPTSADGAVLALAKHHLRLEVMTGPAAGSVFDTLDDTQEVRIGRLPDCSLPLPEDPEVSSRHAIIQFSTEDKCWKLMDVGSLNGTTLKGTMLSTNRQPSKPAPLSTGDWVEFGSTTRVHVTCKPSHTAPATASAKPPAAAAAGAVAAAALLAQVPPLRTINGGAAASAGGAPLAVMVHPNGMVAGPSSRGSLAPSVLGSAAAGAAGSASSLHSTLASTLSLLGPPLAVLHHEGLGISMAVQQRLGADHRRSNTGCEDVAHWEVPFSRSVSAAPEANSSASISNNMLLCVFDGHQGIKAASRAKEVLPQVLWDKVWQAQEQQLCSAAAAAPLSSAGGLPVVTGLPSAAQSQALMSTFLEVDQGMALDEGCTATVVLLERQGDQGVVMQSANVGDSSAVLIQLQLPQPGPGPGTHGSSQDAMTAPGADDDPASHSIGTFCRGEPLAVLLATAAGASLSASAPGPAPAQQPGPQPPPSASSPSPSFLTLPSTAPTLSFRPPPGTECGWIHADGTSTSTGSVTRAQGQGTPQDEATSMPAPTMAHSEGQHHAPSSPAPVVGHWLKLSEDHRISSSAKERERLAQLGHKTVRTRLYGLNIARMLGDRFLKDEALGFTAEPHVSARVRTSPADAGCGMWRHPLEAAQGVGGGGNAAAAGGERQSAGGVVRKTLLVLASDGLWDVLSEGKAAAFVARTLMQDAGTSVAELAGLLVGQAITLRSKDDITVMVAELL